MNPSWRTLSDAKYEVLLDALPSTYFKSPPSEYALDIRRFGHSRDERSGCVQVVIALIVTPEGFLIASEVFLGNPANNTTLRDFPTKIQAQHIKADRFRVTEQGVPIEEILAEMRKSDPPVSYPVGTPNRRLSQLEEALAIEPWSLLLPPKPAGDTPPRCSRSRCENVTGRSKRW